MVSILEKSLFQVDTLEMIADAYCERTLKDLYDFTETFFENTFLVVKISLFKGLGFLRRNKKIEVEKAIFNLAKKVVPKLEVKVLFGFTEKQLESPKFYYLYFKDKKFKKPAFSLLNSLEKERLAPSLKGLFVRVKGKKGTRKDRKTISLGQVKKHSPIKSIKEYTGTLETPLGTTGIQVKLLRKKDCIDYSLERNFKLAQASPLNLSELSSKKT